MPYLHSRGDPASRIWVILDHPFPSDVSKGYIFSGGLGWAYEKMFTEAGLDMNQCYVTARKPDTDDPSLFGSVDSSLQTYRPPLILVVNEAGKAYLPELKPREDKENFKTQLNKYCGSLLNCPKLTWPHYMMPVYGPDKCMQDWRERNVTTYIDFQKLRDELEHWKIHGTLQPLPIRELLFHDFDFDDLCGRLEGFRKSPLLSTDIESIYPKAQSSYLPHPGYPITIGLANSKSSGISFNLFRESPRENRILFRLLDEVFRTSRILGQNFFNFDAMFLEALGFSIPLHLVQDTLIRHHILWPELRHKLQFMTRQYTREPYYKDEGKHWSLKHMHSLRRYNCLDVCVTFEVYEGQEEEFNQRPHLRRAA